MTDNILDETLADLSPEQRIELLRLATRYHLSEHDPIFSAVRIVHDASPPVSA